MRESSKEDDDFQRLLLHELGHSICNLYHVDRHGDIMNADFRLWYGSFELVQTTDVTIDEVWNSQKAHDNYIGNKLQDFVQNYEGPDPRLIEWYNRLMLEKSPTEKYYDEEAEEYAKTVILCRRTEKGLISDCPNRTR